MFLLYDFSLIFTIIVCRCSISFVTIFIFNVFLLVSIFIRLVSEFVCKKLFFFFFFELGIDPLRWNYTITIFLCFNLNLEVWTVLFFGTKISKVFFCFSAFSYCVFFWISIQVLCLFHFFTSYPLYDIVQDKLSPFLWFQYLEQGSYCLCNCFIWELYRFCRILDIL